VAKNIVPEVWRSKYAAVVSSKNFIQSWHKLITENKTDYFDKNPSTVKG
jgi:hypothetical protein